MEQDFADFIEQAALDAKNEGNPVSIEEIAALAKAEHERRVANRKRLILSYITSANDTHCMKNNEDLQVMYFEDAICAVEEWL